MPRWSEEISTDALSPLRYDSKASAQTLCNLAQRAEPAELYELVTIYDLPGKAWLLQQFAGIAKARHDDPNEFIGEQIYLELTANYAATCAHKRWQEAQARI